SKNLTTLAKPLFINKFLSASPPMDVHSTAFLIACNPVFYYFLLHVSFFYKSDGFVVFIIYLCTKSRLMACFLFFNCCISQ
ncbi:hypothetical protein, partial [Acinetobacter sp. SK-43]|uniref:hypothetical protein n=1 Tax=Acinetobacter sp. SK-43 TaxID=2785295 RepID=UPI001D0E24FF